MHQLAGEAGRGVEAAEVAPRAGTRAGLLLELARGGAGVILDRAVGLAIERPGRDLEQRPAGRVAPLPDEQDAILRRRSRRRTRRPDGRRCRASSGGRRRPRSCRSGTPGSGSGGGPRTRSRVSRSGSSVGGCPAPGIADVRLGHPGTASAARVAMSGHASGRAWPRRAASRPTRVDRPGDRPRRSTDPAASPVTWSWNRLWATCRIRDGGSPTRSNISSKPRGFGL